MRLFFVLITISAFSSITAQGLTQDGEKADIECAEFAASSPFLHVPVTGLAGRDWTIVNYVDWDIAGVQDHQCSSKSYDGHQGTDFTMRSFPQMDSGLYVLAAAEGEITFTLDGLFDRETSGTISKGLGNYIAIRHPNQYYSYYGHLKKNSILVNVGDQVKVGDTIAQIGSSGNSTDPHLHFELWFDSMFVVDPFIGPCGNDNSLWVDEPLYETDLNIWETGMHNVLIGINDLRERITTVSCCPYIFPPNSSSPVLFWSHMYGLKKGETLTIEWYNPNGVLWFDFDVILDEDWWYYYYWSFIDNTNLPIGDWRVELKLDGALVAEQAFIVDQSTSTGSISSNCSWMESITELQQLKYLDEALEIFDVSGVRIRLNETQLGKWYYAFFKNEQGCGKWLISR